MRRTTITHNGDPIKPASLKVPSCQKTTDSFQTWHLHQYGAAANAGIELIYPYEDVQFSKKCVKPFSHLSDKFYSLDLDLVLSPHDKQQLLVMPHYKYYNDDTWSTPLPVACLWESWWPMPLTIIFRYGPTETKFVKNEPFAQIIPTETFETIIVEMNEEEKKQKMLAAEYINNNKDKYITRKWVMDSGQEQNNLYNVLAILNKENKLPPEVEPKQKKLKIIRRHDV